MIIANIVLAVAAATWYNYISVSGMAHFLLVKVQSRVVTAKCSEPQAVSSNAKGGVSGVAKLLSLRTET